MSSSDQHTPEDIGRLVLSDALQKLPTCMSQPMLRSPEVLAKLGLPADDTVRIFDKRILRRHLLDVLEEIADGGTPDLFAHNGQKVSDTVSLRSDGSAEIVKADNIARFSNVVLLGDDKPARQKCLGQIFSDGRFEPRRERYWRRLANKRALAQSEYLKLETELLNRAEAIQSEISDDLIGRSATIDILARATPDYLLELIGLTELPDSQGQFQEVWLDKVHTLKGKHLARRLRLSAPMAIAGGNIVGETSKRLQLMDRWKLFDFLISSPEPLSVVAALEIACLSHPDRGALEKATVALNLLWNPCSDIYERGLVNFHTAYIATTALWAKGRTLQGWPLYAQRLARFVHSAHIVRILEQHNVAQGDLQERVMGAFQYQARLAEYRDLQAEPFWQAMYVHLPTLMAYVFRRAAEVVSVIPEDQRPEDWTELGASMMEHLSQQQANLIFFAASPFTPFSDDWSGLQELDTENVQNVFEMLNGTDPALWIDRMLKLQVSFELPEDRRTEYRERISKVVEQLTGQEFIQATEMNLHIAARWRDEALSDDIINIVFRRFKADNIDSKSALARQILLAAACVDSQQKWLERIRILSTAFAQIYPEREEIAIYRNSLLAIGEMSDDLAQAVAPALSMASLIDDQLV